MPQFNESDVELIRELITAQIDALRASLGRARPKGQYAAKARAKLASLEELLSRMAQ